MRTATWISESGSVLNLGYAKPFLLHRLDGNELSASAEIVSAPREEGATTYHATLGQRSVHIYGSLHGTVSKNIDELKNIMAVAFTPDTFGMLTYHSEAGDRQIRCRPTSLPLFGDMLGPSATFDITLLSDSPYWESVDLGRLAVGATNSQFQFPFSFNPSIRFGNFQGVGIITNASARKISPVIEIYTAGTGTTLQNITTNQTIRVNHEIAEEQKMIIDAKLGTVKLWTKIGNDYAFESDVSPWLSLDSLPFELWPGENKISVINDTPNLTPVTYIEFHLPYMGV